MDLQSFDLDERAAEMWLPTRPGSKPLSAATVWDPLEPGTERDIQDLLTIAQSRGALTGPGVIELICLNDVEGDLFCTAVVLEQDGRTIRLVTPARQWDAIVPEGPTGIAAAQAILATVTAQANTLLRQLEAFVLPYETATYDQAMDDSLDVTEGIQAHGICGCGEPIALWEGSWFHVYNEQLRGTDDPDPD